MTKAASANIVATVFWHHVPGTQGRLELRFSSTRSSLTTTLPKAANHIAANLAEANAQQSQGDASLLVVLEPVTVDEMNLLGFDTPEYPPNGSHGHLKE